MAKNKQIENVLKAASDPKSDQKKTEKKRKGLGVFKSLKGVVSGEFLGRDAVERNLPFLAFVTALMLLYIGYQYYADNAVRSQVAVEKEGAELYSRLQSVKERFNEHSLQSKVAQGVKKIGMYESVDPPTAVSVSEKATIE